jgi:4,5-dihydroxyphthalate decarboxylase
MSPTCCSAACSQGIDLTCLTLQVEEIFFRMFNFRDFDVRSLDGEFSSLASQGNSPFVGIRCFPRVPRTPRSISAATGW